jgi:hypothetical protein
VSKSKRDELLNNVSDPIVAPTPSGPDNITESWLCVDCGINTAPEVPPGPIVRESLKTKGISESRVGPDTEMYMVRKSVWAKAGMDPFGGCLCVGCLERRLDRRLKPKDFDWNSVLNQMPGTPRLRNRQGRKNGSPNIDTKLISTKEDV